MRCRAKRDPSGAEKAGQRRKNEMTRYCKVQEQSCWCCSWMRWRGVTVLWRSRDSMITMRVISGGRWGRLAPTARALVAASAIPPNKTNKTTTATATWTLPRGNDGEVLEFVHEIEVKKSRFLAFGWHVRSEEEALANISAAKDPSASHNCWAILISEKVSRYSDDGEPGGTAGKPILSQLEALHCDCAAILVTRYFGGTKLGTGGLIRAYGGAARELLNTIELEEMVKMRRCGVFVPVELVGVAYAQIEAAGGRNVEQGDFDEARGGFLMSFDVVEGAQDGALDKLRDASRGKIVV
jgi:putative IMPACT (imprinted ancient) family translation regulator